MSELEDIQTRETSALAAPAWGPETLAALARRLPPLYAFDVVARAREPQHVPALFTTAIHGALGHALRAEVASYRALMAEIISLELTVTEGIVG